MKSILLVDDDKNLSETLAELIDPKEYRVDILADAPGTVDYIRANGPDVVLLDVNLPSGSGLELLKEIKASKGRRR